MNSKSDKPFYCKNRDNNISNSNAKLSNVRTKYVYEKLEKKISKHPSKTTISTSRLRKSNEILKYANSIDIKS